MISNILFLHILLLLYSLGGVFAKLASGEEFFSTVFIACYAGLLAVLCLYAVGWQHLLRHLPLSLAYAHKAISVIWGLVWGVIIFGEALTGMKLMGAAIIAIGIVIFSSAKDGDRYE